MVRESCHFGAAGHYAAMAAQQGFIALAMANDIPSVIAPGARGRDHRHQSPGLCRAHRPSDPIMLDVALSVVAGGKVMAAHYHGKAIPDTWVVDSEAADDRSRPRFLPAARCNPSPVTRATASRC